MVAFTYGVSRGDARYAMARSAWPALHASVLVVFLGASASAAPISISGLLGVTARDTGSISSVSDGWFLDSQTDSSGTTTAVDGASSSTETFTITDSSVLFEFTQLRAGAGPGPIGVASFASVDNDQLQIWVVQAEPVLATLSGSYTVTDTGGGGRVFFETVLESSDSFEPLHHTLLESRMTANESFALGQNGGDLIDTVQGPLSHVLYPGTLYVLSLSAGIVDLRSDASDTGATASGYLRIALAPIPEPSTALLFAAGLIAFALRRRSTRVAAD